MTKNEELDNFFNNLKPSDNPILLLSNGMTIKIGIVTKGDNSVSFDGIIIYTTNNDSELLNTEIYSLYLEYKDIIGFGYLGDQER